MIGAISWADPPPPKRQSELDPCPWCGETDRLEMMADSVRCYRCNVCGPMGHDQSDSAVRWNHRIER